MILDTVWCCDNGHGGNGGVVVAICDAFTFWGLHGFTMWGFYNVRFRVWAAVLGLRSWQQSAESARPPPSSNPRQFPLYNVTHPLTAHTAHTNPVSSWSPKSQHHNNFPISPCLPQKERFFALLSLLPDREWGQAAFSPRMSALQKLPFGAGSLMTPEMCNPWARVRVHDDDNDSAFQLSSDCEDGPPIVPTLVPMYNFV